MKELVVAKNATTEKRWQNLFSNVLQFRHGYIFRL